MIIDNSSSYTYLTLPNSSEKIYKTAKPFIKKMSPKKSQLGSIKKM